MNRDRLIRILNSAKNKHSQLHLDHDVMVESKVHAYYNGHSIGYELGKMFILETVLDDMYPDWRADNRFED